MNNEFNSWTSRRNCQPLKKRTVGQTNIAHVSDFTSVQLRYIWGGDNTQSGAECVMFNIESLNWLLLKLFVLIKINLSNANRIVPFLFI